jgi:hypothetical protein
LFEDLRPLGISDAAKQLGIEPFEVVRLLVVANAVPEDLRLSDQHIAKLRQTGGIEFWWKNEPAPTGDNARRAQVCAAIGKLLEKKVVGGRSTRVDNLWRGLSPDAKQLVEEAVEVLIESGHLASYNSPRGPQLSVPVEAVPVLQEISSGGVAPTKLADLW